MCLHRCFFSFLLRSWVLIWIKSLDHPALMCFLICDSSRCWLWCVSRLRQTWWSDINTDMKRQFIVSVNRTKQCGLMYCALYFVNTVTLLWSWTCWAWGRGASGRISLMCLYKYLKRGFKEDRASGAQWQDQSSDTNLNTKKHFLTVRALKPWQKLPREILDCWRCSKVTWEWSWAVGSRWPCCSRAWTKWPLEVTSHLRNALYS